MAGDGRVYDGHTFVFGTDTDTDPSALPNNTVSRAVNRIFRGGRNRTRPPFEHKPFSFDLGFEFEGDAKAFEELVKFGNFQGWMPYRKKKPGRQDGVIVAIAGNIFFLTLVNERIFVRFITGGNDPKLLHTWFVQAEEWVYIQNGKDRPIFWNGLFPSTARRSDPDPALAEMPVGTVMAYIHGRVWVSNAFDQVVASDIIYGDSFTSSDNTQRFTENQYWAGGGYFGTPTDLGAITGMGIMARQGQLLDGQGELVVICENGAYAIQANVPREQWQSSLIQAMTLNGRGCVAPESVVVVNNDLWFRSDDGLASYQNLQYDEKRQLSFGKASKQVNRWFNDDTTWLTRYASAIYFDNRILCTVSPFLGQPKDLANGTHRYHRGILALDLDQASGVSGDTSFNWDGLWTGMRPCALLRIRDRAFAFSYDSDGENRIYEIKTDGLHDGIEDKPIQTEWFYITKRFDWADTQKTNEFEVKKLIGGECWFSDVRDLITIGVDYRADNSMCWSPLMKPLQFGSDFGNTWHFTTPRYGRKKFETPETHCDPAAAYPTNHGSQHQIMVYGKGQIKIDRVRIAMNKTNDPSSPVGDCSSGDPKKPLDKACKLEDDYSYDIAASR